MAQAVHVTVDNADEIGKAVSPAVKTEEKEPEHFDTTTFVLTAPVGQLSAGGGGNRTDIAQVLSLDPLRKDAGLYNPDTPVVYGTYRQCQDLANQAAGVPYPQGAYVAAGGNISLTGTGPLWVVNTTPATTSRVSAIINRRDG
jgi:hypothetical protein